jgi:hypothetical protein
VGNGKIIRANMNKGDDVTDVGGMVRLVMCQLVNGDDLPIVGEHHRTKHRRGDRLHSVHVVASEQDIVIKRGIDNFNVNEDGFAPKFYGDILTKPYGRCWSTVISSKRDGRGY